MRSWPVLSVLLLALSLASSVVRPQCTVPTHDHPYFDNIIIVEGSEIWTEDRLLNGSLVVEGSLEISGATLVVGGEGMKVMANGSLRINGSVLKPYIPGAGFYIESHGDLVIEDSEVYGCVDHENGLIGIYSMDGAMILRGTTFLGSGLLRSDGPDVIIDGSSVPGMVSSMGDQWINGSEVTSLGLSHYGEGSMRVSDTLIRSNLSFSTGVAAISVLGGGHLEVGPATIQGSYDGGIYAQSSAVSIADTSIDLPLGLYGVMLTNSTISGTMSSIDINGTDEGFEISDCLGEGPEIHVERSSSRTHLSGLHIERTSVIHLDEMSVEGPSYGLICRSPVEVIDSTFINNSVGIFAEEGDLLNVSGCRFEDYDGFAIQEETWTERPHNGNIFEPGDGSTGDIAWWGLVDVSIEGPDGIAVEGADLRLTSSLGANVSVPEGEVGAIWGYQNADGPIHRDVVSTITARWGDARASASFLAFNIKDIELMLPLSDLIVTDVSYSDGEALVTLQLNGSDIDEVVVSIYLDGSYRSSLRMPMTAGEIRTIRIPIDDVEDGQILRAEASSRDEYKGTNGVLQNNNAAETGIDLEKDDGMGDLALFLLLLSLSMLSIVLFLLLRRKD